MTKNVFIITFEVFKFFLLLLYFFTDSFVFFFEQVLNLLKLTFQSVVCLFLFTHR